MGVFVCRYGGGIPSPPGRNDGQHWPGHRWPALVQMDELLGGGPFCGLQGVCPFTILLKRGWILRGHDFRPSLLRRIRFAGLFQVYRQHFCVFAFGFDLGHD